jgi:hypothetical protein
MKETTMLFILLFTLFLAGTTVTIQGTCPLLGEQYCCLPRGHTGKKTVRTCSSHEKIYRKPSEIIRHLLQHLRHKDSSLFRRAAEHRKTKKDKKNSYSIFITGDLYPTFCEELRSNFPDRVVELNNFFEFFDENRRRPDEDGTGDKDGSRRSQKKAKVEEPHSKVEEPHSKEEEPHSKEEEPHSKESEFAFDPLAPNWYELLCSLPSSGS